MGIINRVISRFGRQRMAGFMERRMMNPPERNTREWLEEYGKNPRLSPVAKISQDLASVSGKLQRESPNGKRKEIKQHPFLDFWEQPNPLPEMTASAIWRVMEVWRLLKGEAYAVIERGRNGYPAELWPVPPHLVIDTPHLGAPYYVVQSQDGRHAKIPAVDMFVLRELNPVDPYGRGLGQAEAVADEVESYEYATKFSKRIFYNNARPDYWVLAPNATQEQSEIFQRSVEARYGGIQNAYKPGVIPFPNASVVRMSDSPKEMDFVASRKDLRDTVNSHFGVPPELLGIVENSNRATAQAAKAIYAENVLTPILLARQDAVNRQLLPQFGDDALIWVYDDIIPQDEEYKLKVANDGLAGGAMLINEWREKQGIDPLPNGDVLYIPGDKMPCAKDADLTEVMRQSAPGMPEQTLQTPYPTPVSVAPPGDTQAAAVQVAKEVSLTGAQISSLLQIVQAVNSGELTRDSAVELITSVYPFDAAKASAIIGQPPNPKSPIGIGMPVGVKSAKKPVDLAMLRRRMAAAQAAAEQATEREVRKYLRAQLDAILAALDGKKTADDPLSRIMTIDLSDVMADAIAQITGELDDLLDWDTQDERAGIIASNEAHVSMQAGNFAMLKAAGYTHKTWLSSGDPDVRDSHAGLNGKTYPIDERFPNGLLYPGDPSGPAGETINCRCDLVAGMGDDQSGGTATAPTEEPVRLGATNYFNTSPADPDEYALYVGAQKVQPIDGYEDVFVHGDLYGFQIHNSQGHLMSITPNNLKEYLKASRGYQGGDIRLVSCSAGGAKDGAAQQLADLLGVIVMAPTRDLWIGLDGEIGIYDEFQTDTGEYLKIPGEWVIFKPRR
mgnify:CR=1 FL=1